jgi:hypothetical protein
MNNSGAMMHLILRISMVALLVLILSSCGGGGGGGGGGEATLPPGDTASPMVTSFYPDPAQGDIYSADLQSNGIYVMFDEAAMGTTVTSATFYVIDDTSGGIVVPGTTSYVAEERKAKFAPDAPLTSLFLYTVTPTTAITDLAGNHMENNYSWQFQVSGPTPPPPPPQ